MMKISGHYWTEDSRLLTVETLSDANSQTPLSPCNLLTRKTSVVLPPPGNFDRPDLYWRRRWTRIQHIAGGILVTLEKRISSEPSDPTKMEYKKPRL